MLQRLVVRLGLCDSSRCGVVTSLFPRTTVRDRLGWPGMLERHPGRIFVSVRDLEKQAVSRTGTLRGLPSMPEET